MKRNLEVAVQLRRHDALSKGLLVYIHDLGLSQAGCPSSQVGHNEISRAYRVYGKDCRMNLDSGRDAENRDPCSDGIADVPGRAISAGKKQKIHLQSQHLPGSVPGVFRSRFTRFDRANDRGLETTCPGRVFSHFTGVGDDLEVVLYGLDPFKSQGSPV